MDAKQHTHLGVCEGTETEELQTKINEKLEEHTLEEWLAAAQKVDLEDYDIIII